MRLLIFVDWYLPGYKAGGQISSCANIVFALQDTMDIYIITRDRDLDDTEAYPGIKSGIWQSLGNAKVNYLPPGKDNFRNFKKLIKETAPDTIYFNSMFSYRFTLLPLILAKITGPAFKIIIAPRGMLQAGAMQFKTVKKKTVLAFLYYTGVLKNIFFHATDEREAADIKANINGKPGIKLVYDFPAVKQDAFVAAEKKAGYLDCVFISRVVEKKNLLYLLQLMAKTRFHISLTVAGPVEDKKYWEQCRQQIETLPANCKAEYIGAVPNNLLPAVYRRNHLFVLPTYGENFGHVIFDAFLNGRPVLISDQTPWQQLSSKKIGYDINIKDRDGFLTALEQFAAMDKSELESWSKNAWLFARQRVGEVNNLKDQYKSLFS